MVTGEEKRIICLRGEKNALYDEVFFVLREGEEMPREQDMLREANRILEESLRLRTQKKRKERGLFSLLSFLLGGLSATLVSLLVVLL